MIFNEGCQVVSEDTSETLYLTFVLATTCPRLLLWPKTVQLQLVHHPLSGLTAKTVSWNKELEGDNSSAAAERKKEHEKKKNVSWSDMLILWFDSCDILQQLSEKS